MAKQGQQLRETARQSHPSSIVCPRASRIRGSERGQFRSTACHPSTHPRALVFRICRSSFPVHAAGRGEARLRSGPNDPRPRALVHPRWPLLRVPRAPPPPRHRPGMSQSRCKVCCSEIRPRSRTLPLPHELLRVDQNPLPVEFAVAVFAVIATAVRSRMLAASVPLVVEPSAHVGPAIRIGGSPCPCRLPNWYSP